MRICRSPISYSVAWVLGSMLLFSACSKQDVAPGSAPQAPGTTVGTDVDDTLVSTKVRTALLGDPEVKAFDIKVDTRKGKVLLSGFVDSQVQVDRILSLTKAVDGAKDVENGMNIKVGKASVGNKLDDGIVTAKIKSAFLSDSAIKSNDIGVVTRKGDVLLSGFVNSQTQIDQALKVARAVEGVQSVVSEMSVKK